MTTWSDAGKRDFRARAERADDLEMAEHRKRSRLRAGVASREEREQAAREERARDARARRIERLDRDMGRSR